jgi:hypothetical protein
MMWHLYKLSTVLKNGTTSVEGINQTVGYDAALNFFWLLTAEIIHKEPQLLAMSLDSLMTM